MFPKRENFPQLNDFHDLKHIVHDLKKEGIKDFQVIDIAKKQNRVIITKNTKDFKRLCAKNRIDLITVTEVSSIEEVDNQIMAYLRKKRGRGVFKQIVSKKRS
jgi:regulator of PEP synthase PpsR (kinase-PPPase family)